MRLIDADDLRNWILRQKRLSKNYTIMILDEMKTIDPESIRKCGRWLKTNNMWNENEKFCKCSNCNWGCNCDEDLKFKYCPNCGVKMDLGKGEA